MNASPDRSNSTQNKEDLGEKVRNIRRSKVDIQDRKYECTICGKSYLSYPALYTHKKNKHRDEKNNSEGVKKVKEAKSEIATSTSSKFAPISAESLDYFDATERKGHSSFIYFSEIFRDAFNDIFKENWDSQFKEMLQPCIAKLNDWDKYNLYIEFIKQCNPDSSKEYNCTELISCDQVLAEYLQLISKRTNPSYFKTVVKFVMLFREFLNKHHKKEKQPEYTASNTAEDAPQTSNEFVIDFMGLENPKFGFKKEESTELTVNLCRWMLDERYTAFKLSMK